jgi:hypothetical protein
VYFRATEVVLLFKLGGNEVFSPTKISRKIIGFAQPITEMHREHSDYYTIFILITSF